MFELFVDRLIAGCILIAAFLSKGDSLPEPEWFVQYYFDLLKIYKEKKKENLYV